MRIRTYKTIFLVEDDPDEQFLIKNMFSEHWQQVKLEIFKSPLTLFEYIRNPAVAVPGMIITDLYMPVMDGIEETRLLRNIEKYRNVPVVMLTGSSNPSHISEAYREGVNYYLSRPVNIAGYADLIQHLKHWYLSTRYLSEFFQKTLTISLSEN